jgi:hypothetical protein
MNVVRAGGHSPQQHGHALLQLGLQEQPFLGYGFKASLKPFQLLSGGWGVPHNNHNIGCSWARFSQGFPIGTVSALRP